MEISKDKSGEELHDNMYMNRCLSLAAIAQSYVAPNPMVGAVLVVDNQIISEGYHHKYGLPHAEPNAIHAVKNKSLLQKATLYVNLEPCSHFGKTPPCANLIVESGIPKVVIGTLDPNPKVAGRGVKILQEAGIEVKIGVLEKKCRSLNRRFFVYQEEKRPFVLLKWAQTADGFIDKIRTSNNESPVSISNNFTQQLTHKMRSENQSILVSTNTVILDNPSLTVRHWSGKNPIRIALDRRGLIPESYNIVNGKSQTLIFTQNPKPSAHNLEYIYHDFESQSLKDILNEIYKRGIHSVLVEGGAKLLTSFIASGLWDEANIEISKQLLIDGVKAPIINKLASDNSEFEGHKWLHFYNSKSNSL
jgi:diaminohydroxyphosphoribosylaminopyrimidine deaminase/5-amino-6-(5-phosphoribosylamino)uracil reductase